MEYSTMWPTTSISCTYGLTMQLQFMRMSYPLNTTHKYARSHLMHPFYNPHKWVHCLVPWSRSLGWHHRWGSPQKIIFHVLCHLLPVENQEIVKHRFSYIIFKFDSYHLGVTWVFIQLSSYFRLKGWELFDKKKKKI